MDSNPTIAWLAAQCRLTPIDEKWLLVEHLRVGQQWKDRLTRSGCWHINLHAKSVRLLVNQLAAPWLSSSGFVPTGSAGLQLLVDRVVQDAAQQNQLQYFQTNPAAHSALSRLLVRTYNDCRLAGLAVEHIDASAMEVPAKAHDLSVIFANVRQRLLETNQVDYADCIAGVIAALKNQQLTLPPGLVILQPEPFPLAKLERDLLELLRDHGAAWHEQPSIRPTPSSPNSSLAQQLSVQVAVGEINEIRGVFQHCFSSTVGPIPLAPTPLDHIEVLVADYELYAPLALESIWHWLSTSTNNIKTNSTTNITSETVDDAAQVRIENLPITFAEGIACIYSRPGRLLRSWIRWADSDYLQSKAVQILREGLLLRPKSAENVGYARLASGLRGVPIGFGLDRYLPQLTQELADALRDAAHKTEHDPEFQGDCGSSTLQAVLETVEPLVRLAPTTGQSAVSLLESAAILLSNYARAESLIDRYARAKLLEDINGMMDALRLHSDTLASVRSWLEELPTRRRLLSGTPQPGCVHVAPLEQGGASGRPRVFLLGLDDRKFPRRQSLDPILLDAERSRISTNFITSEQLASHQHAAIDRVIQRLQGTEHASIVFSRSLLDLNEDCELFASPVLSRLCPSGTPVATVSFMADRADSVLSSIEAFHRQLLLESDSTARSSSIELRFPRMLQQQRAHAQQRDPLYTAFDGWVPEAGADLLASATTRPMSPSRLETLGSCPRKYFFARALGIVPPDEWNIDPDRWLTPIDVGNLLHELFEEFLQELRETDEVPDPSKHTGLMIELLETKIADTIARVPVHNTEAFQRQREELLEFCEIFLQKEHEYAMERRAKTWIMEASLGSLIHRQQHAGTEIDTDEPIVIELGSGRNLHLCGRIDRIDRLAGATPSYLIWDYKTGSAWGFDQGDVIQQGRKLQPLLYARMLVARFAQLGHNPQSVEGFGYFFPSPRCEGLRYEWKMPKLLEGDRVLESMLDLLASGTFIATNNKDDCRYCDYQGVCGPVDELVSISKLKSSDAGNPQLEAWRQLRG